MPRKVIIDCDPGIDDAVALCMALFDPRLEVVAITAVAGAVNAERATANVQSLVERLDPPRYPRLGAATDAEHGPDIDKRQLYGEDGLGNAGFAVSQLARQHPSEKLICDEVHAAPNEVTLICLGPLTNIARAIQRDPLFVAEVGRIVISGGSLNCIGNATACGEFNMVYDAFGARVVFRSATTKSLIPLDITTQIGWNFDLIKHLPSEETRAGRLLHKILPHQYRACRQELALENIYLHDAVTMAAVLHPELFTMSELSGDIEIAGELTTGATIFDRRPTSRTRGDMEVAVEVEVAGVADAIIRSLQEAGRQTA